MKLLFVKVLFSNKKEYLEDVFICYYDTLDVKDDYWLTGCSPVSPGKEEPASVYFDATEENSKAQHSLSPVPESNAVQNRLVMAKLKSMSILENWLMHYMSTPHWHAGASSSSSFLI